MSLGEVLRPESLDLFEEGAFRFAEEAAVAAAGVFHDYGVAHGEGGGGLGNFGSLQKANVSFGLLMCAATRSWQCSKFENA